MSPSASASWPTPACTPARWGAALHVLASPAYLARRGAPRHVEELAGHSLLGFTQTETLNHWPLRHTEGDHWQVTPTCAPPAAKPCVTWRWPAAHRLPVALHDPRRPPRAGRLQLVLAEANNGYRQPINAVYYRNTQLALRIQCFLDFIQHKLSIYACTKPQAAFEKIPGHAP